MKATGFHSISFLWFFCRLVGRKTIIRHFVPTSRNKIADIVFPPTCRGKYYDRSLRGVCSNEGLLNSFVSRLMGNNTVFVLFGTFAPKQNILIVLPTDLSVGNTQKLFFLADLRSARKNIFGYCLPTSRQKKQKNFFIGSWGFQ